ncbi:MAG: FAD-dependent oxidoreductase [Chloroflexi bacterium]|nr:FAD-dependent oxidoreductase [Chloroflexota bacterium]
MTQSPRMTVYGALWCPDCRRSKQFLAEHRIPYSWVDIEQEPEAQETVRQLNDGRQIIPTIVFDDGGPIMAEPSNAELAARLGINPQASRSHYDLIIVGGGPAGLTAAIYAAREGMETLIIERGGIGGQAGSTERIDNYPGFADGVSGADLADRMREQAERFGVEILVAQTVASVDPGPETGGVRTVTTQSGQEYRAPALLLTPGTRYRRLDVPGEDDFIGAGVHFCATCDGPFYRDLETLVVGGGNSGVEEGLFLTRFASRVTVLERGDRLRASQVLQDKAAAHPKMDLRLNTTVREFRGDGRLASVLVEDLVTGDQEELHPAGVFVFIGLDPNTGFLSDMVELDQRGFIVTGGSPRSSSMETDRHGVFAAGDARAGSTKQVATAVGEGAAALIGIRAHMEEEIRNRGYRGDN